MSKQETESVFEYLSEISSNTAALFFGVIILTDVSTRGGLLAHLLAIVIITLAVYRIVNHVLEE